ncbi:family 10 glycosylhydrolase [Galbibacter sp. PAP.153]|uniref:glycoside hydrolase family 10 protein n=1 Tax=Galbibacter sp. PAP.153 TaxID=3104623 RepID=UPI00300B6EB0
MNFKLKLIILILFFVASCKSGYQTAYYNKASGIDITKKKPKIWQANTPYNIEEFRAAWVATVANINWPSKPGLSTEEQKEEALSLLDFLVEHNYNAVIFQVRPQCDALYQSNIEPWSYYLTGKQGNPPAPFYDPLKFWVEEAHKRGLELHAWLNPYRAHHTSGGAISENSIVKTHPELVVELANGMWWMDPALEATKKHSLSVVEDIVKRYDIDGIHFDDYFYPYDSYNDGKDFPDDKSWQQYKNSEGKLNRSDWRRKQVNDFIKIVYHAIKKEKPYVKFGLSPFGIWRPGSPQSVTGYDQYNKLYADAKLWLNKGWIDYFTPQLYWEINKQGQSFPELLGWWSHENYQQRHLWPGIRVDHGGGQVNVDETINQIMISRGMLPKSKGTVHWSIGPLIKYDTLSLNIVQRPYAKKALVPPSPWLDNIPPENPISHINVKKDEVFVTWKAHKPEDVFHYIFYFQYQGTKWDYEILTNSTLLKNIPLLNAETNSPLLKIGITAVDRTGNQSQFKEQEIIYTE